MVFFLAVLPALCTLPHGLRGPLEFQTSHWFPVNKKEKRIMKRMFLPLRTLPGNYTGCFHVLELDNIPTLRKWMLGYIVNFLWGHGLS